MCLPSLLFFSPVLLQANPVDPWVSTIVLGGVALITFLFRKKIADAILSLIFMRVKRRDVDQYNQSKASFQRSLSYLIPTIFLTVACVLMPPFSERWQPLLMRFVYSLLTGVIFWFIHQLIVFQLTHYRAKKGAPLGVSALTFVTSVLRVAIVVVGCFAILSLWVSDLTGIIAGLGIGGLALSLAAQDTIGNFLGSLSILLDGTFKVGDFIETTDFSGTVEEIGVRSSKVRDFNGARISVPNKILAQSVVTNVTERKRRRIELRVTVSPFVPIETVGAFQQRLCAFLEEDQDVVEPVVLIEQVTPEGSVVYLTCMADRDFDKMRAKKSDILYRLGLIAKEMGIPLFAPRLMVSDESIRRFDREEPSEEAVSRLPDKTE